MAANTLTLPVMESLRLGTRELHERIETNPLHSAIVNGTITRESYCLLLSKMHGFHSSFETHAGGRPEWAEFGFDFQARSKLAALESDLAAMGNTASCAILPLALENAPFAVMAGFLYVSEGSTLGGQILIKHLAAQLGVTRNRGGAYFASYGPLVGEKWKECREFLAQVGASSSNAPDEMVSGARDAFSLLDAWLR